MKERFAEWTASVKAMWQNASKTARIVFLAVVAGILVFCLVATILFNRTNDVLLFDSNKLSPQEYASVMTALEEAGIETKPQSSGAVYVSENDVDRARMRMAMNGYASSGLNYDTYNAAANSLTSTQSDRDVAYLHDLQDRLQATIETFDEVNQAIVNISMPRQTGVNAYNTKTTPATASVMITRRAGAQLSQDQIAGIMNVMKHSIPGLTDENVSIVDSETGDLIAFMDGSMGAASNKMALTEQMNAILRNNVLSLIQPVYGADKVKVAASTVLDSSQHTTESQTYTPADPENPTNNPKSREEYYREKDGGQDNLAQGVPGANDNVNVPQYNEQNLDVTDGDRYVASGSYDYLVNSQFDQIVQDGFRIERMTVAVVVDLGAFTDPTEFNNVQGSIVELVKNATGIENTDDISVHGIRFVRDEVGMGGAGPGIQEMNWILIISGVALVALAIIFVLAFTSVQRKKREQAQLEAPEDAGYSEGLVYGEDGEMILDLMNQEDGFEPITLVETPEQKLKAQIKDLADNDPEIVAQLIKTWLVNG